MVIGATQFCARLRNGIFLRATCCSLNRLSANKEAQVQQLQYVEGASPFGDQRCADGIYDQPNLLAASQGDPQVRRQVDREDLQPEVRTWFAKDQQVLNYLLSSLSREIMS
jgi:hypothetical protein